MTRNADVSDFVSRGDDGEPLTVTETVELDGDTLEVEFVPATKGLLNELDSMEPETIEADGIPKVLAQYRTPDFRNDEGDVPEETINDIPLPLINELFDAFLIGSGVDEEALKNPEEYAEGNLPSSRNERAEELRS